MKRVIIVTLFLFITTGLICAQQIGGPDPSMMGENAQQMLKEVSVDRFEIEGFWRAHMSSDEGYAFSRLFLGGPADKQPIPDEEGMNIPDLHVLGTRVDFLRRGHNSFAIRPLRPIPIEGVTKTVSMWVAGRGFNHRLYLLVQDFFDREHELFMGRLNFQGWQQLTMAIPPQSPDGRSGVVQWSHHHNNNHPGIRISGFRVRCDPMEAQGTYYIYFDDLRAVTDLFIENNRDPDDMTDGW